jgi:cupin superfamily acireductone dioxygenase involved in methionine salvage
LYFPVGVPWNEYKISFENSSLFRCARTNFTNILQTNQYFTKNFTNDTNKIQNTNGYKNIDIVIDIDIDILVNFVRFQRTEI